MVGEGLGGDAPVLTRQCLSIALLQRLQVQRWPQRRQDLGFQMHPFFLGGVGVVRDLATVWERRGGRIWGDPPQKWVRLWGDPLRIPQMWGRVWGPPPSPTWSSLAAGPQQQRGGPGSPPAGAGPASEPGGTGTAGGHRRGGPHRGHSAVGGGHRWGLVTPWPPFWGQNGMEMATLHVAMGMRG